ncbi:helix-turn-helix domain-containing protein [Mycobacterium sp. E796]|uniref:helix-turn-helix domain-containing protein n=1 Tax=Mycobacterium sp. E796 TaxID=1834151 RepID=UPI0007FD5896|nr:helix-turn-helix domain-containing protein [Mycobacterium sp. E796]OBI52960.1 hypothetical protein A5706_22950 [Mycobacterium sp. E796]
MNGFNPREFRRALRGAGLSATEYRVAVELCEYTSPDRPDAWPSVETLAAVCGVSRRTVQRVLSKLSTAGLINAVGGRAGGRYKPTVWRLRADGPVDAAGKGDKKGDTGVTLSAGKGCQITPQRVTPVTKRVTPVTQKGDTDVTRRSKEGEKEGGGKEAAGAARAAGAAPPHPPLAVVENKIGGALSPYCSRHQPDGTDNPCYACGQARQRFEAREVEEAQAGAEEERRRGIAACGACDENGFWGEPGLASYDYLDYTVDTRAETLTPVALFPPPSAVELPAYLNDWRDRLTECTAGDGLTWWALKCWHGTGAESDNRRLASNDFALLLSAGFRAAGLDAFLAAGGDLDAAHKLRDEARADWRRRRDERFRASKAAEGGAS